MERLAELVHIIEVHENKAITVRFRFDDQITRVISYLEHLNLYPLRKEDDTNGTKEPHTGAVDETASAVS